MGFLNYLMLGTPASPLYKSLMDSGLGEALIGGGMEDELRQPTFSVGLKVSILVCVCECWGRGEEGKSRNKGGGNSQFAHTYCEQRRPLLGDAIGAGPEDEFRERPPSPWGSSEVGVK